MSTHAMLDAYKAMKDRKDAKEKALIDKIRDVHCGMSPENVSCDGECTRAETNRRMAKLQKELKALIKELGRTPTDEEIYG